MIINNIDTKNISFVVQGEIDSVNTPKCLESIRKNFPGSTIILSAWEKSDVGKLDFDILVCTRDPGGCPYDIYGVSNNINRQILSSRAGMEKVTTDYVAKVRNDLIFDGANFLYYFNKFPQYNNEYKKVQSRMIALSVYSRLFHFAPQFGKVINLPFYFSDWFLFGFAEDIKNFYATPLIEDLSAFSSFYLTSSFEQSNKFPFQGYWSKMTPENYLTSSFFSRAMGRELYENRMICDNNTMNMSTHLIANNVVILDYAHSKIYSGKWEGISKNEFSLHPFDACSLIFYSDFVGMYKRCCDKNFVIPKELKSNDIAKMKCVANFLLINPMKSKLLILKEKIKDILKRIMHKTNPAYHVADGIRNEILNRR